MDNWQLRLEPEQSGRANMDIDLQLFHELEEGRIPLTLRVYSWRPRCISLGYAQKARAEIDTDRARALGWDVVMRPTGGGIVFHNEAEVTYSLVTSVDNPILPHGLIASYEKISEAIVCALNKLGVEAKIKATRDPRPVMARQARHPNHPELCRGTRDSLCFSYPAEYEIVCDGRKIVGSAQKRGKRALLQQGSIFVRRNPADVYSVLKKDHDAENAISVEEVLGRKIEFNEMYEALMAGFKKVLGVSFGE